MNLTEITLAKIKELGTKPASEYFGVTEPTIRSWMNTKKVPASAAQKVMDGIGAVEFTGTPPPASAASLPGQTASVAPERMAAIENRVAILESRLPSLTGPATVPPQPQPNWTSPHNFRK